MFSYAEPYHMPLCSQSRPYLDFSVWSCSHLGCVDLCKVVLLCLWILCSIFSIRQKTNRSLLPSSISSLIWAVNIFHIIGKLWVCNCLGVVPLLGSFCINVVLPLVIRSGTCAPCKHLFISRPSLSWMEVDFLNHKPCIPSWPGVFQFDIF